MLFNCRIQDYTNIAVSVARKLLFMLLLQTAPQNLPYSSRLMNRVIFLYLFSGIVVLNGVIEPSMALPRMILSILVLMGFSYLVLSMLGLKPRFVQTVTALVGTGVIFNLMSWPLLGLLGAENVADSMANMLSLLILMLISWEVMVTAHIYRHALNMQLAKAIILSIGLFLMNMTLSQLLFPPA